MKKLIKLLLIIFFTYQIIHPTNIYAAGDLEITWDGVPNGDPIFTVENMLPGDNEKKEITIKNIGSIPRMVVMKAVKTDEEKDFSQILDVEITENSNFIYGGSANPKKLNELFDDTIPENELMLYVLNPGETKTAKINVYFPHSAVNEWQRAKVVFNLIIGVDKLDHLVINEVYYDVSVDTGSDSVDDGNFNADISGNGEGSTNIIDFNIFNTCVLVQENNATVTNNVNITSNTGFNSILGNIGSTSIITGQSSVFVNVFNIFNINISQNNCCCESSTDNDEWVEIFNPTDETVNLKDWSLTDNSGTAVYIPVNAKLEPGNFALISKSLSTWQYWNEDSDAIKITLNEEIGNGLGNNGDHLILKKPNGDEEDFVAWEDDNFRSSIWYNLTNPKAQEGNSIERLFLGFDNDTPTDFEERNPPTPGN